jgi:nucleoside-diphosphate-sugar epimerase
MNSITITGASGFVGQNLQTYLNSCHELKPISVRYIPNQTFDLKGDAIIHLAGKAHDLKKVSSPQHYYDANFELTKQLFDSFLQSEATVFIFMSTVKAVADAVEGILDEGFKPNPITAYGKSKLMAEHYILSKDLPVGKRVYVLRPCMIHGPGNKGNLNLLYNLVSRGVPWPLGAFENKRSFLSIENLCFVIKELLDNTAIPSGIYNIADDDALSTNQLIILMNEAVGKKPWFLKISKKGISIIAKIGDLLYLPLNSEKFQKLTESYVVSNEKIKKALKIDKLPISASEGILKTIHSFKKQ